MTEPLSERLQQRLNDLSKVTQKGGESNGWSEKKMGKMIKLNLEEEHCH